MNIVIGLLTVILVVVCLLMVLIVMMQRPKQEGLGAAFGGGMTDQMFGAQTTNVLQKGTVYLAVMFFGITLLLSVLVARRQNRTAALGSNLSDQKAETTAAGDAAELPGTGADLLSETPLVPETTPPVTPAPTEGTTPAAEGETEPAPVEGTTPAATESEEAGEAETETPVEAEATPAEPTPATIDDAAPLPDNADAPEAAETPADASPEAPAENTDAAGDTPNL